MKITIDIQDDSGQFKDMDTLKQDLFRAWFKKAYSPKVSVDDLCTMLDVSQPTLYRYMAFIPKKDRPTLCKIVQKKNGGKS